MLIEWIDGQHKQFRAACEYGCLEAVVCILTPEGGAAGFFLCDHHPRGTVTEISGAVIRDHATHPRREVLTG